MKIELTIKHKLLLLAVGFSIMLTIGGLCGVLDAYFLNVYANDIAKAGSVSNDISTMESSILICAGAGEEIAEEMDQDLDSEWARHEASAQMFAAKADAIIAREKESKKILSASTSKEIFTSIEEARKLESTELAETINRIKTAKTKSEKIAENKALRASAEKILGELAVAKTAAEKDFKAAVDKANLVFRIAWYQLIIMISLAVIFSFAGSVYFIFTITKPLKKLEERSHEMSRGNLAINIDEELVRRKDEIGALSNAFQNTASNLRAMVAQVVSTTETTAKIASNLSTTSDIVSDSMKNVSTTIKDMADENERLNQFAYENQKETETLMKSVKDVTGAVTKSTKTAGVANDIAKKSSSSAKIAGEKINSIKDNVAESSNMINELGSKMNEVNKIIEVINSISEETNLLALNAAIEAARAGDVGRGFAVVADEVRKLAEESRKATEQIELTIKGILSSTNDVIGSMQKTTKAVDESSMIIGDALSSLDAITGNIVDLAEGVASISESAKAQMSSSEKVQKSVFDVSQISEKNATGTEEISASVIQTSQSMSEVALSARELVSQAEALRIAISQFKIK